MLSTSCAVLINCLIVFLTDSNPSLAVFAFGGSVHIVMPRRNNILVDMLCLKATSKVNRATSNYQVSRASRWDVNRTKDSHSNIRGNPVTLILTDRILMILWFGVVCFRALLARLGANTR
ncbi:hypothetical protein EV363DRAFT_29664 [Boletus edulis]|nr:hypothetical protein EV363DRAFT_29664 [Boletus edulis]